MEKAELFGTAPSIHFKIGFQNDDQVIVSVHKEFTDLNSKDSLFGRDAPLCENFGIKIE